MSSVFIDLKIDYAFKMVLGRAGQEPSLRNFLNAMLYDGRPVITDVEILNPYMPGDVASLKDTFVDILAETDDGSTIIIEMQMSMKPAFFKRMVYNVAKKYSAQLDSGDYYDRLKAVIGLVIANFSYPQAAQIPRPITKYALLETTDHILYPDSQDFQIVIAELPKFQKQLEQVADDSDMWLYMLNYADGLVEVPSKMAQITEINTAFEAAKRINWTAVELDELEKRRMYALSAEADLALTRQDALAEGIDIGRRQMVQRMLQLGMSVSEISKIAQLSLAQIQQIEQEQNNGRAEL